MRMAAWNQADVFHVTPHASTGRPHIACDMLPRQYAKTNVLKETKRAIVTTQIGEEVKASRFVLTLVQMIFEPCSIHCRPTA